MGNLIRYPMNLSQLRQYLQAFTGQEDVTVMPGGEGSTHVPTRIVKIDPSSPLAPTTASHEGLHITSTSQTAMERMHSTPERMLLNALEDGRMERLSYTTEHPGLQAQFQDDVDYLFPQMLLEPWLAQTIKGMYLLVGGYAFDEAKLKKQARSTLTKFRPFITPCRRAPTTDALADLVPEIIKLFNLPDQSAIRKQKAAEAAEQKAVEESEKWWADQDGNPTGPDEHDEGGKLPQPDAQCTPEEQGLTPGGEPIDGDYEGDPVGDGNGGYDGQSSDVPEEVREAGGERDAIEYNADELRNAQRAAEKLGARAGVKANEKTGGRETVRGHDKVTGGPTVNHLLKQGARLANSIRRMEGRAQAEQTKEAVVAITAPTPIQSAPGSNELMDPRKLPASMAGVADLEKEWGYSGSSTFQIDPRLFSLGQGHGGLGYAGGSYRVQDGRRPRQYLVAGSVALETETYFQATENYLSRMLRMLMQSADRKGIRDYERTGLLDSRRAYHVNEGVFTIFRQPPRPRDNRPVVILTVDQSGSMNPGFNADPEYRAKQPAWHAMCAAIVLSGALARLGIPHEIHGFSSSGTVIKRFEDPAGRPAVESMSNLWVGGGGGTSAAEALGFAWARIVMRPEPRKIVIQVTDGQVPNNTKLLANAIEKMGGTVIGVGIGKGLNMRATYAHTFEAASASDLPNAFARLLKRFIPGRRT